MKKVISIKPAEEIVLCDPVEKKEWHGYFNMRCVLLFQEILREKGINSDNLKEYDLPAMCLYAVLNTVEEINFEDVVKLSRRIGPASGSEIITMFMESLHESLDDEQRDMLKKVLARQVMGFKSQKR